MAMSYPGHAVIDPENPEALGICDRCGSQWNLRDLRDQMQWNAVRLYNTGLKVCPTCYDEPSEFLRTLILPPDPAPVLGTRPAQFYVQEKNNYTIRPPYASIPLFGVDSFVQALIIYGFGITPIFAGVSSVEAELDQVLLIDADFDDTGSLSTSLTIGKMLSATLDDTSSVMAAIQAGFTLTSDLDDTSAVTADLLLGKLTGPPPSSLITEAGDTLVTEAGDMITTEFGAIQGISSMAADLELTSP